MNNFFFFQTLKRLITSGKECRSGNQLDMTRTPARRLWNVRAEYMARAPPCEKPPNRILVDDNLDADISSSIRSCNLYTSRIMLFSSSILFSSIDDKSNQAAVGYPLFNVNGIFFLRKCEIRDIKKKKKTRYRCWNNFFC